MEQKSMTALVSAFSRAYHSENNNVKIFDDSLAGLLLTDEEYNQIAAAMSSGIGFFNPEFKGSSEETLRWIVDNQLSPSPLGRAAYTEKALETAVKIGAEQYVILAAGYDTFAYRQPEGASEIQIFEVDHPMTAADKAERIARAGFERPKNLHLIECDFTKADWEKALTGSEEFDESKLTFCSLLGLVYYLPKLVFEDMLTRIGSIMPKGSTIVFDYPDENTYTDMAGERTKKQTMMAGAAKEEMKAAYSYGEMEKLLERRGFLIYEHLVPEEITEQYFKWYNEANPKYPMSAFDNVNYCLAVRR